LGELGRMTPHFQPKEDLLTILLSDRRRFVDAAQRILKCRARAEDVVQEAALRIWQNTSHPELRNPASYLHRMVRNLAIDGARRGSLECRLLAPIADADHIESPCACPQARMEACQALTTVFSALDEAPARSRRALLEHRLEGVPQKVIAAENGISPTLVNFLIRDMTTLCREAIGEDRASAPALAVV
jgi:RNA polymerase sigma-70 factor, ECF subfamily